MVNFLPSSFIQHRQGKSGYNYRSSSTADNYSEILLKDFSRNFAKDFKDNRYNRKLSMDHNHRNHLDRLNALVEKIVSWLKDYTLTHRLKSLTVGVSGGIDSAVTSTLAAKTGLPVYALNMPIKQKKDQEELSDLHLDWLKKNYPHVTPIKADLTDTFFKLIDCLQATQHEEIADHLHAQANSRSRLRMVTLYHIATATHGLVVGTGNKIEDYGIGFFTKYGDGGVDIAPIADLYKSEVYRIADILGIESAIRETPPTDGLWDDDRNDHDQIGCSYDELEMVMRKQEGEDIPQVSQEISLIYEKFNKANHHKMIPIPTFKLAEHGFFRPLHYQNYQDKDDKKKT